MSKPLGEGEGGPVYYEGPPQSPLYEVTMTPDGVFEHYGARAWLDEIVVTTGGGLDIPKTAANIGIPVKYDEHMLGYGKITGLGSRRGLDPIAIHLATGKGINPDVKSLTFGHETGHFFLEVVAGYRHAVLAHGPDPDIEAICEYFGREMVVPNTELKDAGAINEEAILELMGHYKAGHYTMIIQLMLAGKLPKAITLDTTLPERLENPYYAGKVRRHVVCLDCELCKPHVPNSADNAPLLDFTGFEWGSSIPMVECNTEEVRERHQRFRAVNQLYGRWTPVDEAMHKDEIKSAIDMRALLRNARD